MELIHVLIFIQGKLTPNMVMLGFKSDWQNDIKGLNEYIDVIHHGFDVQMAMGILRLAKGCDFSNVIGKDGDELTSEKSEDEVLRKDLRAENFNESKFLVQL